MKPLTVKVLKELCEEQIKKGNGDRIIMISDDDEGNGYHYLWYSFITPEELDKENEDVGLPKEYNFNYNDERVSKKEDTIVLG